MRQYLLENIFFLRFMNSAITSDQPRGLFAIITAEQYFESIVHDLEIAVNFPGFRHAFNRSVVGTFYNQFCAVSPVFRAVLREAFHQMKRQFGRNCVEHTVSPVPEPRHRSASLFGRAVHNVSPSGCEEVVLSAMEICPRLGNLRESRGSIQTLYVA